MFFDPTTLDASGFCQFPAGRLSRAPIFCPMALCIPLPANKKRRPGKVPLPSAPAAQQYPPPSRRDELLRYDTDGSAAI